MGEDKIEEDVKYKILNLSKNKICNDHFFTYIKGNEVVCSRCPLGYQVTPNVTIVNGKLMMQ